MAAPSTRRRKQIGHRRRVEDEGEEGVVGAEGLDLDDDSLTEGSLGSDEHDAADDSDTSNVDEDVLPTSPNALKSAGKRAEAAGAKQARPASEVGKNEKRPEFKVMTDVELRLRELNMDDANDDASLDEIRFDDVEDTEHPTSGPRRPLTSAADQRQAALSPSPASDPLVERKRREHEDYKRERDNNPTFVPNRGNFFMHDFRHPGPSGNGFRLLVRGVRAGRGRLAGPYPPSYQPYTLCVPMADKPWTHDMHDAVAKGSPPPPPPPPRRSIRQFHSVGPPPNGNGFIPTARESSTFINREMSHEKVMGRVTARVWIPSVMETPATHSYTIKLYTKLPDHRPPLRRDKPVRISLPYHDPPLMPRHIYPAQDRSFIFIPRAMRPNSQPKMRSKGARSVLGSIGGFSRRTSVWGGSFYGGSVCSPSIALSRRSSVVHDMGRDHILSPTGSTGFRPPLPLENARPVVRLPPFTPLPGHSGPFPMCGAGTPTAAPFVPPQVPTASESAPGPDFVPFTQPQTYQYPRQHASLENRPPSLPMHQPHPQKTISMENTDHAPYQSAFHQQVPPQVSSISRATYESHVRQQSFSHHSAATPLSHIPERAIHAAPFQPTSQPNPYAQPAGYYPQSYPMAQPPPAGYYYPQEYMTTLPPPHAGASAFMPASQQPPGAIELPAAPATSVQSPNASRLISQDIGGTMYYFDPAQVPAVSGFVTFPPTQSYAPVIGMGGMMAPPAEGYYYPMAPAGMVPVPVAGSDYLQYNYQAAPVMVNTSQ